MALRGDQGDKPGESSHSGHHDNYTASPANDGLQKILCFCLKQYFMLPNNMILLL